MRLSSTLNVEMFLILLVILFSLIHGNDRFQLKGKKILVTGGSKGIGKEVVEEVCELGASVLTCSRNATELEACCDAWTSKGYDVHTCVADVGTSQGMDALVQKARDVFVDSVDCLVNNVGTNIRKPSVEYSDEEYDTIMNTNLKSTFKLSMRMHPFLKKSATGGSVVNIGSVAGGNNIAIKSGAVYAMTKAAINQLSMNLACEWAMDGIRVNAVCPWYIRTPLVASVLADEEKVKAILSRTPMGRIGEVDEVSGIVAFLCMDVASYITGQLISVDGGFIRNGWW